LDIFNVEKDQIATSDIMRHWYCAINANSIFVHRKVLTNSNLQFIWMWESLKRQKGW